MMWFNPRVEGTDAIRAEPRAFLSSFAGRIETGLFPGAPASRNMYAVTRRAGDALTFRSTNWLTSFNVGLNDVDLSVSADRRVRYTIEYWRWAKYAILLSGALGVVLIAFFTLFDAGGYLARNPESMVPGLSIGQNVAIGWAMVFFWGFAWPWILIALHKKPLRRLMARLVAEVDAAAMTRP
jgi:hypothetical protein